MSMSVSKPSPNRRIEKIVRFLFWFALIATVISCLSNFIVIVHRPLPQNPYSSQSAAGDNFVFSEGNYMQATIITDGAIQSGDDFKTSFSSGYADSSTLTENPSYTTRFPSSSQSNYVPTLEFSVPGISSLISLFLTLAPVVMMAIYVSYGYEERKAYALVPLTLFALCAQMLFPVLFFDMASPSSFIFSVAFALIFLISGICVARRRKTRIFITICATVNLVYNLLQSRVLFSFDSGDIFTYFYVASYIGTICFFVALLLFAQFYDLSTPNGKGRAEEDKTAELEIEPAIPSDSDTPLTDAPADVENPRELLAETDEKI